MRQGGGGEGEEYTSCSTVETPLVDKAKIAPQGTDLKALGHM